MSGSQGDAIARLERNGIRLDGSKIELPLTGPGLKLWAVIDFLVNKCGFYTQRRQV